MFKEITHSESMNLNGGGLSDGAKEALFAIGCGAIFAYCSIPAIVGIAGGALITYVRCGKSKEIFISEDKAQSLLDSGYWRQR